MTMLILVAHLLAQAPPNAVLWNAANKSYYVGTPQAADLVCAGCVSDDRLSTAYSGVGVCGVGQFATTLARGVAPTCTQPAFSNLSGTASVAQGGTTETASAEDAVLVGSGTTDWQPKVLPDCTAGKLLYTASTNTFSCGTDQVGSGAGTGTCGANQWASTLNAGVAPTCTQPGFANLSGSASIAQGGTTETASTEDAVLVGSSTTDWQPKVLPNCSNAATSKLLYDSSTNAFSCGTDTDTKGTPTATASTPARALNTNFTPSTALPVWASYAINIVCTSGQTATFELRSDAAATPTTVRASLFTNIVGTNRQQVSYLVPAAHNVRLVNTGTCTQTISNQAEVALSIP